MNAPVLYGLCGAALVGIGLYGLIANLHLLRRIIGFNVAGSGSFLLLGSLSARYPTLAADPVPQAMIITGIVIALASTALALALAGRLHEETSEISLSGEAEQGSDHDDG